MKRFILLLLMIGACPGCALVEDMVFGPDPHDAGAAAMHGQGCSAPLVVNTAQTQEPELSQMRR